MINHCAYWKAYFRWALDNNLADLDVRSTPTPIKIYTNGFALKTMDDLPEQWRHYFYETADCRSANRMIADIFRNQNIAWPQTDNKYKMFIGGFEQLENFLRENRTIRTKEAIQSYRNGRLYERGLLFVHFGEHLYFADCYQMNR